MKHGILRLTAVLALAAFCAPGVPVCAEEDKVMVSQRFDSYKTNETQVTELEITGGMGKIVEAGANSKALMLPGTNGEVCVSQNFTGALPEQFVLSLRLRAEAVGPVSARIGIANGSSFVPLIKIEKNQIQTLDGKPVCGVRSGVFTELTILCDRKAGIIDLYADGRGVLRGWRVSGLPASATGVMLVQAAGSGGMVVDDLLLYGGTEPRGDIPGAPYLNQRADDLYIDQDVGDFTYFYSHAIASSSAAYFNFTAYPKTNAITCERYDYKNVNKGECIIFEKSTSDDCYVDIAVKKIKNYNSEKTYQYFMLSSDVWIEKTDMQAQMFLLRDTKSSSSQINSVVANLNGTGIVTSDGRNLVNTVKPGQWFNYKAYVRLDTHTADIYIDGALAAENVPLDPDMKSLNLVRFSVSGKSGPGTIKLKNFEVTGMVNPPENGTYEKTSLFPSDAPIRAYLQDKVSFHHYAGNLYRNGEKSQLLYPSLYEDGGLYLSAEDISRAFDVRCAYDTERGEVLLNGQPLALDREIRFSSCRAMIPVREFAAQALGRYVLDDTFGMVVVSEEPMYFDVDAEIPYYKQVFKSGYFTEQSTLQQMNAFLFFQRPQAEAIREAVLANTEGGTAHPRLMATRSDFERILEDSRTDAELKRLIDMAVAQADNLMTVPICTTYTFQDVFRMNGFAMTFEKRMLYLGFAYQMTGAQKYADRAWLEIEALCKYPDINENHPIDAGSFSAGLGIGYDWLYHGLTEEQRKTMASAAERLSLSVMDRVFYAGLPGSASTLSITSVNVSSIFTRWKSNYNLWINGGLVLAALAYAEEAPELSYDLLEKSIRSIEFSLYGFAPDGQWPEGNQYWDVCASNLAKAVGSLHTAAGTDYGLMKYQGLDKTGYFAAGWASPLGSIANGDTIMDEGIFSYYSQSFLASYYNQPGLAYLRKMNLSGDYTGYGIYAPEVNPLDIIYYMPGVTEKDAAQIPRMLIARGGESVTIHEDYTNPEAFVFAAQGGQTTHYHSHNDSGAFAFDMMGVRWATDLGKEDYNLGVSDSAIYRKRTEGHNTLTINNGKDFSQARDTFATLTASGESETGGYAVYDMSDLYSDADSVLRGFYIGDDYTSLTVRDELELSRESEVYWFMHTRADIEILDEKTALLSRNGKSLVLQLETDAPEFALSAMDAVGLPSSPVVEGQETNAGIRKVAVRLKGNGKMNLTVRMSPQSVESLEDRPIAQWKVPEGKHQPEKEDYGYQLYVDGVKMQDPSVIPVLDEQDLPAYTIVPNDPEKSVVVEREDRMVGGKLAVTVYNQDRTKSQMSRIIYSSTSGELLNFFDTHRARESAVTEAPEPANAGPNAIDGDLSTRWTSKTIGAEAVLDFGESITFDAVAAAFWKGSERNYSYTLYGSEDGVTYEEIGNFTTSGQSEEYEVKRLGRTVSARYIRFVNGGNNENVNGNLTELLLLRYRAEGEEKTV